MQLLNMHVALAKVGKHDKVTGAESQLVFSLWAKYQCATLLLVVVAYPAKHDLCMSMELAGACSGQAVPQEEGELGLRVGSL